MHIFTHRRNFHNGLRCGLHFIIKVTAKVWTLWGQNCCNDMDLNVDVDLPKNMCVCSKYIVHQLFPETSFQSDSSFFCLFIFSRQQLAVSRPKYKQSTATARPRTDVHGFLKPTGFFTPPAAKQISRKTARDSLGTHLLARFVHFHF